MVCLGSWLLACRSLRRARSIGALGEAFLSYHSGTCEDGVWNRFFLSHSNDKRQPSTAKDDDDDGGGGGDGGGDGSIKDYIASNTMTETSGSWCDNDKAGGSPSAV